MEQVLDIYKRPYDKDYPIICMDESPKQLIGEAKTIIPAKTGYPERHDYEYVRNGVCNIFMACEPLAGKRMVKITERKTKIDWAVFIEEIALKYPQAKKITLVMDNFKTHSPGSFYDTFLPNKAKLLRDRFDFIFTPKHGSWLNIAEIELNVLTGQCLNRRISDIKTIQSEVKAWVNARNNKNSKVNWRFTSENARIKLKRLYPTLEE